MPWLTPDAKPVLLALAMETMRGLLTKATARLKKLEGRRCSSCKWWRPDQKETSREGYGACTMVGTVESRVEMKTDVEMFDTPPNFGCVLHEEKTDG